MNQKTATFNAWITDNISRMMERLSLYTSLDEDAFQDAYLNLATTIKNREPEALIERRFVAAYKRISGKHISETYATVNPNELFFNLLPAEEAPEDAKEPKPIKWLAVVIKRHIRATFPKKEVMAWEMRLDGVSYRDITDSIGMSRDKTAASGRKIAAETRKAFNQRIYHPNMKLREYAKKKPSVRAKASEVRMIAANRKGGFFCINVRLLQDLGLTHGDRLLIARDEDSRNDWYATFGGEDLPGGTKLRKIGRDEKTTSLRAQSKAAVNDILDSVNAEQSASFMVALKPKMQDGKAWYRIMTANPVRKR